jgi:thioredoxin reductase
MTRSNTELLDTTPGGAARPAVSVDPITGRKRFDTRARRFTGPPSWGGYAVVGDEALKTLPDAPAEAHFDERARARYDDYKQARRGTGSFVALAKSNLSFKEDPFATDPVPRDALHDECEILVIGAGFAGLMLWYKLQQAGFDDVRFCDKGGDVGGTWYFNRYPGVACDVEAYSYLPLLEEMEYIPPMKFASGFEIYQYCQRMAERFGFYDRCLVHTAVNGVDWDAEAERWVVTTDRGDAMRARFVVLANGILTTPKLARIDGMETFGGESFHTSRWDYDISLEGKTVGIIGTGATAVQVIPEIAKVAEHLFVFQRTPSTVDVRDQRETTSEERTTWPTQPNWPGRWTPTRRSRSTPARSARPS